MKLETKLFSQMLSQCATEYGDRPALTCRENTITFRQLKTAVDRCSLALAGAGFQKGDTAVLWGFNGIGQTGDGSLFERNYQILGGFSS